MLLNKYPTVHCAPPTPPRRCKETKTFYLNGQKKIGLQFCCLCSPSSGPAFLNWVWNISSQTLMKKGNSCLFWSVVETLAGTELEEFGLFFITAPQTLLQSAKDENCHTKKRKSILSPDCHTTMMECTPEWCWTCGGTCEISFSGPGLLDPPVYFPPCGTGSNRFFPSILQKKVYCWVSYIRWMFSFLILPSAHPKWTHLTLKAWTFNHIITALFSNQLEV